jgi:hypothetical protein
MVTNSDGDQLLLEKYRADAGGRSRRRFAWAHARPLGKAARAIAAQDRPAVTEGCRGEHVAVAGGPVTVRVAEHRVRVIAESGSLTSARPDHDLLLNALRPTGIDREVLASSGTSTESSAERLS